MLLDRPLVLYELMIEKLVIEVLKKPWGAKRSSAIMAPLSKNRESNTTVDKNELKT